MSTEDVTLEEFQRFVDSLFVAKRDGADGYYHAAGGASGEAGELLDIAKKHWVYGKPIDHEHMLEEIGDCLHYLVMLCIKEGVTLKDAMRHNVEKLKKRYPDGYTHAAALARADKQHDGASA